MSSDRDPVIDWLLDADPAIRWQVMRDLTGAPADAIAAERARVASEGWGPRLLDQQRPDGQWGDGVSTPFWWSNMYTLLYVRDMGVDPTSARARAAIDRVRSHVTWGPEFGNSPFFEGEVEPCINGRVVGLGAYFGERSDRLVDRLLGEQLEDGGWNCEAERGSVRSSFHTTICVLEGLLAFERAFGADSVVTAARARAEEYLLERRLLRRLSSGDVIDTPGRGSHSRRCGTTTCCAGSTTCAPPARGRTREWMRPSRSCAIGARTTGAGGSTCDIQTPCTRSWPESSASPIAGSRYALFECCVRSTVSE